MTKTDLKIIVTLVGIVATGLTVGWLVTFIRDAKKFMDPSAIQITQVYTQGSFSILVVIAVLLAVSLATSK